MRKSKTRKIPRPTQRDLEVGFRFGMREGAEPSGRGRREAGEGSESGKLLG
jgi:hypothetical protein